MLASNYLTADARCPQPTNSTNGTVIKINGLSINSTVLYKCPKEYRVSETGSIYYNLTCDLTSNETGPMWSAHPQIEGWYRKRIAIDDFA